MTDTYEKEIHFTPVINKKLLRGICKASITDFESMGVVDESGNIFLDNHSPVLFVAHRDYVCNKVFCSFPTDDLIFSPQLDDRLGIYVALDLLPQYGIIPDILLTKDEEIGQSTAKDFKPTKEYNWIFQFDRRLDDAVTYQYKDRDWIQALIDSGFKVGSGTFSDICYLDHAGVCGVNVGVAYNNEHYVNCYANVPMLLDQIDIFATFWNKNKDTKFPHTKQAYSRYTTVRAMYSPGVKYFDHRYGNGNDIPDSLDCEYCWQEFNDLDDINHILSTGMCITCDAHINDGDLKYGNKVCEVCGVVMPDRDFKYGLCEDCYNQMEIE